MASHAVYSTATLYDKGMIHIEWPWCNTSTSLLSITYLVHEIIAGKFDSE